MSGNPRGSASAADAVTLLQAVLLMPCAGHVDPWEAETPSQACASRKV